MAIWRPGSGSPSRHSSSVKEAGQPDAVLIYGAQVGFFRRLPGPRGEIIAMFRQSASAFAGVPAFRARLASQSVLA